MLSPFVLICGCFLVIPPHPTCPSHSYLTILIETENDISLSIGVYCTFFQYETSSTRSQHVLCRRKQVRRVGVVGNGAIPHKWLWHNYRECIRIGQMFPTCQTEYWMTQTMSDEQNSHPTSDGQLAHHHNLMRRVSRRLWLEPPQH